jgi:hypothetical protein
MSCRAKAIVTLVVIAPILTEIVSGNTPPHALLHPQIALFLIAAYSFPLLVLRELSVRWRLDTIGVFVLGLAYGFLNEGLIAQTLIRAERVPMPNFNHYVYAAGVDFSWVAVIVPWHALMAVVFPLALLAHWFPSCSRDHWLGNRTFAILVAVLIACVAFIGLVRAPHPQMRAFLLVMALLVATASLSRAKQPPRLAAPGNRVLPFFFGMVLYAGIFLTPMILATRRVEPAIFFAAVAGVLLGFGLLGRQIGLAAAQTTAMVALGSYFAASVFNMLGGFIRHSMEALLCGGLLAGAFALLWRANPQLGNQTARGQS